MSATAVATFGLAAIAARLARILCWIGIFAALFMFSFAGLLVFSVFFCGLGLIATGLKTLFGKEQLGFTSFVISVEIIHTGDVQVHEFVVEERIRCVPYDLDSA